MRRALAGDDHGTLRLLGGVLFGVGALVLFIRRSGVFADPWDSGAIFVTVAIPALLLYGAGLLGARANVRPTAWQAAFVIFGLLLIPVALFAFVDWVGGETDSSWNVAWILALSGLLGFVSGLGARVRYACLLGGLLTLGAWLSSGTRSSATA